MTGQNGAYYTWRHLVLVGVEHPFFYIIKSFVLAFSLLGDNVGGHIPPEASNSTIIHPRPGEVGFGKFSFQYVSLPHIQVLKSTSRKTHMTIVYEADSLKWRLIALSGQRDDSNEPCSEEIDKVMRYVQCRTLTKPVYSICVP
jgi:hypothetical protein